MSRTPFLEAQRCENAGATLTTSRGAVVTANAAPHVKGIYTQLIAATSFEADGLLVMLDDCVAVTDYLLDIALGSAGNEVVILTNLLVSGGTGALVYGGQYQFPVKIPVGSRLSARCQATTGGAAVRVSALLFGQGVLPGEPITIVDAYGLNTAATQGTNIDPGGVANTKGAWVALSTSTRILSRFLTLAIGNQLNGVRSSQSWLVDIGLGGAGSEQVVIPNLVLNCSTSPDIVVPQTYNQIPFTIPIGSRLSVRAQSDGIDATDRLFDAALYLTG